MAKEKRDGTFEFAGQTVEATKTTLPDLWSQTQQGKIPQIVAACGADFHIQATAPIARCVEDWYEVQRRALVEIQYVLTRLGGIPLLVAGDIFDRWNPRPEVVNFALKYLPKCYAIPGNHDLPYHDYEQIKKSAYWTLVEAGKIVDIKPGPSERIVMPVRGDMDLMLHVYGVPHGSQPTRTVLHKDKAYLHIALVHEYVWKTGHSFPGAGKEDHVSEKSKLLNQLGYDVGIFGDNHKGFLSTLHRMSVINCGTLVSRNTDEREYRPRLGLIHADGSITPYYLDISLDRWATEDESDVEKDKRDAAAEVVDELINLADGYTNFNGAVNRYMKVKKVGKNIENIVREAIEESQE